MVEEGHGRIQTRNQPLRELRPGEPVMTAAGVVHWHGAAPDEPIRRWLFQIRVKGQWHSQVLPASQLAGVVRAGTGLPEYISLTAIDRAGNASPPNPIRMNSRLFIFASLAGKFLHQPLFRGAHAGWEAAGTVAGLDGDGAIGVDDIHAVGPGGVVVIHGVVHPIHQRWHREIQRGRALLGHAHALAEAQVVAE